jgi:hypothetical protein
MSNMKYFFVCLFAAAFFACVNVNEKKGSEKATVKTAAVENEGQKATSDSSKSTTIEWLDPAVQDLGKMEKGQIAEITWKFRNTGSNPLYVTDVRAGCGCTTPDPPKEPIAPGAEGVIKAKFNSTNFSGHVTKEVYVEANNSNRNNSTNNKLTFTADIK